MLKKVGLLLLVSAGMTVVETILVYYTRTSGPMPFKIKFLPDFEL